MPVCMYLPEEESVAPGYKLSKTRLILLLAENLVADFKLKPTVIYQLENLRALKGAFSHLENKILKLGLLHSFSKAYSHIILCLLIGNIEIRLFYYLKHFCS